MSEIDNRPRWNDRPGRYEVWFLTMSHPEGRNGYWIRYTLRVPPDGPGEPRLWFARFDRQDPSRTFGINGAPSSSDSTEPEWAFGSRVGLVPPGAPPDVRGAVISLGDATFGPGEAIGSISGAGHDVRWDLTWPTGQPTFRLLPAPLYRGRLAPTRPVTPNPDTRFSGTIEVDGEKEELEEFPGQQGHVEGTRHAERWAWASCTAFGDQRFAFQAISAQSRRARLLTPFATFAAVRLEDRWVRFRSVSRDRSWGLGTWRLSMVSRRYRLEGQITAPREAMIRARYHDPDGTPRWCHNSEVASSRLLLWERRTGGWQEVADLESDGTTHAEWAGKTPATAIAREHVEVA
jgi:hypothetical protein